MKKDIIFKTILCLVLGSSVIISIFATVETLNAATSQNTTGITR